MADIPRETTPEDDALQLYIAKVGLRAQGYKKFAEEGYEQGLTEEQMRERFRNAARQKLEEN